MPCRRQRSMTPQMASIILGWSNWPGTPSEMLRSAGPIITMSTPGTASKSSQRSKHVFVHMVDDLLKGEIFVIHLPGPQAVAAHAPAGKLGPTDCPGQ